MKATKKMILSSCITCWIIPGLLLSSLVSCSGKKDDAHVGDAENKSIELSSPVNSTLEELAASFVLAVKKSDPNTISEFLPTKEDVENILLTYEGTEKEKKAILAKSEENTKTINANTFKSIDEIINKGKEAGINWEETSYAGIEKKTEAENKTEAADVIIKINYKNIIYKIRISECIKTARGWLIFDKPVWKD